LSAQVRDRLCAMTPSRADARAEVHARLDAELFAQVTTTTLATVGLRWRRCGAATGSRADWQ
jgi:hypothetical protein